MNIYIGLAVLLCLLLSGVSLYLASPHQMLLKKQFAAHLMISVGLLWGIAGYVLLNTFYGAAISAFIVVIVLMLLFSAMPPAIAYRRYGIGAEKEDKHR